MENTWTWLSLETTILEIETIRLKCLNNLKHLLLYYALPLSPISIVNIPKLQYVQPLIKTSFFRISRKGLIILFIVSN